MDATWPKPQGLGFALSLMYFFSLSTVFSTLTIREAQFSEFSLSAEAHPSPTFPVRQFHLRDADFEAQFMLQFAIIADRRDVSSPARSAAPLPSSICVRSRQSASRP
jgi:hypothetical protein